jgi:FMN phosphatase YigB (HAD superfamily)
MRVKVVFIDWDQTLSTSRFWGQWETSRPQLYELIQKHLFGSGSTAPQAWMRGQVNAEQVIKQLALATGIEEETLLGELKRSCQAMELIDPSVKQTITTLRSQGINVVIATDNMDTFPRWTVPALGLADVVDGILDSHTLGVLKKDTDTKGKSRFFQPYLSRQGVEPREAVLFDDNARYVEGFGIQYVQVTASQPLGTRLSHLKPL